MTYTHLQSLTVRHFRNCTKAAITFCPHFNLLIGKNGIGKTNLLDAIHYLCVCKSHFAIPDHAALQQGAEFFRLEGEFATASRPLSIACKYPVGQKKVMELNRQPYKRLADHIGLLPVVMIAPDDGQWLEESSEHRRQLIDFTLSQLDRAYLDTLSQYNQCLKQRNALLKQSAGIVDVELLAVYDAQLAPLATYIHQQRQAWSLPLQEQLQQYYALISGGQETVAMPYESDLAHHSAAMVFQQNYQRDVQLQRTTKGVHRDDWTLSIAGNSPLRRYASQGQRKSFLLALRLAQHALLRQHYQQSPLLLLDDVFDKLDNGRMLQLLQVLGRPEFGQVFLTDTHPHRLSDLLSELGSQHQCYEVGTAQQE